LKCLLSVANNRPVGWFTGSDGLSIGISDEIHESDPRLHRLFRHSLPALLSIDREQETRVEDHKKRLEQLEAVVKKAKTNKNGCQAGHDWKRSDWLSSRPRLKTLRLPSIADLFSNEVDDADLEPHPALRALHELDIPSM